MKKEWMIKTLVIGIISLFICMSINPSFAFDNPVSSGNTLYVGGSGEGNYTKIQDAINDAFDGDIVFVYDDSSPYYEHVEVYKSVSLIGEDKNTTVIAENGIRIRKSGVNIHGFTFKHGGISSASFMGFINNLVISDNNFIQCQGLNFGIEFQEIDNSYIISNTFINCSYSIYLDYCSSNKIANNIFIQEDRSYDAITCEGRGKHIIINNTFIDYNEEIDRIGLILLVTSDNIIEENEFDGFSKAIWCQFFTSSNIISHNTFINNDYGFYIGYSLLFIYVSFSNRIINNNFINNNVDAYILYPLNLNIFDGNYWDEWIGLKIPILSFFPYIYFKPLSSIIDLHPAKEPYNMTSTQGCGIE